MIMAFGASSAEDSLLISKEKQLSFLLDSLRNASTDAGRTAANKLFYAEMKSMLQTEGAFEYKFTRLKSVGIIDSPDRSLRIVNWNVEREDLTHSYYCFLLHFDKKKKEVEFHELKDNSFMFPGQPEDVIGAEEWYGALYYSIIPISKGSKTLFTLLGWDGNNSASNIKLVDVLYFNGSQPKLGSPIFKLKDKTVKRIFFEHSEKAIMSLRYEDEYKRIIYDHLSPEAPGLEGIYSFYVPDFSYDALMLDNGKWILKEDVIGVNKGENEKMTVYAINERNGKIEKSEVKNKWISPEDEKAPAGGTEHKAVTPEDDMGLTKDKKAAEKDKEKKIRDKRDPSEMNSTLGGKKPKKKRKK
jgi:hypothetical protein